MALKIARQFRHSQVLLKHSSQFQVRAFSNKKEFDYQAFEEEIRRERQRTKNQSKNPNLHQENSSSSQQQPSKIVLTAQVTKDLQLLNVPKYVSKEDLKKQYHKLAKIYHPDILQSKNKQKSAADQILTEQQKTKMEERFKEFNLAYERLIKWINERDSLLDDDLLNNRRPGVTVNTEDGSVTYTIGKLKIEGKRSTLDKQQLLLEMIEEDLNLKEPVNIRRNLIICWLLFGAWFFYKDFKEYYKRMSQPVEGVDYDSYRLFNKKVQQ